MNKHYLGLSVSSIKKSLGIILFAIFSFTQAQEPSNGLAPGQSLGLYLGIYSEPNLRDIGGYITQNGQTVMRGKTYRSNAFNAMSKDDELKLEVLQLKSDYDLRTPEEIKAEPDIIPSGIQYISLNVMADHDLITPPRQISEILQDPKTASLKLGSVEGVNKLFISLYRDFVSLPSAQRSYRDLYLSLSDQSKSPGVFHCTNGKDRTGWAAAALLTYLGVPKEVVYADYLRSNEYLLPVHQKEIDQFIAKGGDKSIPVGIFGVKREYLQAAFDEVERQYGSIDVYFSEGLKLSPSEQQQIKSFYLDRVN